MPHKIAFVTYETPFAPGGGIAAVMGRLPRAMAQVSTYETVGMTPYHFHAARTTELVDQMDTIGEVQVTYQDENIPVEILHYRREISWYFFRSKDERFFTGDRHPYDLKNLQSTHLNPLLKDSIFFGAALLKALPIIDPKANWILLLQDWEAAALALSTTAKKKAARLFLTLHNSYDQPCSPADLLPFNLKPETQPGYTVLQRILPKVERTIFTVSDQFAMDFQQELLQSRVMAPHLKEPLVGRLQGIDNGLFADLAMDLEMIYQARGGNYQLLQAWKQQNRQAALEALDAFHPSEASPVWGDPQQFDRSDAPWFVQAGRDDPRQKGYEVAALAVEQLLQRGIEARFLFFPIPGDEGMAGVHFLKDLAESFPRQVLVFPFLFQHGYFKFLQAANFGIMPSYYEPFGMANEFYMKGVVGIGRATGGILQQIVPLRSGASFSAAVQRRTDIRYGGAAPATGILYREPDGIPGALNDWEVINQASYARPNAQQLSRLSDRSQLGLVQAMVRELSLALQDGIQLYQEPARYFNLLSQGILYLQENFSWQKAASEYLRQIELGEE